MFILAEFVSKLIRIVIVSVLSFPPAPWKNGRKKSDANNSLAGSVVMHVFFPFSCYPKLSHVLRPECSLTGCSVLWMPPAGRPGQSVMDHHQEPDFFSTVVVDFALHPRCFRSSLPVM